MKRILFCVLALMLAHVIGAQTRRLDLTRDVYFVKEDGTGDGSSWENAMSGEDFAYVLPLCSDGASFFVAEGTYRPVYDKDGLKSNNSSELTYSINKNVSIYGGYSNNTGAGGMVVSEPSIYKTIFSGDFYGNDKIVESIIGYTDSFKVLVLERPEDLYKDNAKVMFSAKGGNYTIKLDGIYIEGAGTGLLSNGENTKLIVDFCKFSNNENGILFNYLNNGVSVSNSSFDYHITCTIESLYGDVDIKGSTFVKNTNYILHSSNDANVILDSVFICKNSARIKCENNSELNVFDSEFYENICFDEPFISIGTYNSKKNSFFISRTNFKNNKTFKRDPLYHNMLSNVNFIFCPSKKIIMDSCEINNNIVPFFCRVDTLNVSNSIITENYFRGNMVSSGAHSKLSKSFFSNNVCDTFLVWTTSLEVVNSTFIGNKCIGLGCSYFSSLYNNTIIANKFPSTSIIFRDNEYNHRFIGNICIGNLEGYPAYAYMDDNENFNNIFSNNVLYPLCYKINLSNGNESFVPIEGLNNNLVDKQEIQTLLSYLFEVDDNGDLLIRHDEGFTPTVILKSDVLPNGRSIRFPLSETKVADDQRGLARFESTCMGAYEIPCSTDTTILFTIDTIIVGEKFLDVTYNEIGRYDTIPEFLKSINGCDSIVMHSLVVRSNVTSIDENSVASLNAFVNPANNELTIVGGIFNDFEVFDIFGRIVLKGKFESGKTNISTLDRGVYLIKCKQNSDIHYISFIKK